MNAEGNAFMILNEVETVPEYITREPDEFFLPEKARKPLRSEWVTLTINRGKRDKLSKRMLSVFFSRKAVWRKMISA